MLCGNSECSVRKATVSKDISARDRKLIFAGIIIFGIVAIAGMILGANYDRSASGQFFWQVGWPAIVGMIWFAVMYCFFEYKIYCSWQKDATAEKC